MDNTSYKLIKMKVEQDRQQFNEQLTQIRASRTAQERREGSPFGKREEEASETADFENLIAQEQRLLDQLVDIESAIKKLESGTYGFCQKCGQRMETARLEAMPTARLCMKCAQIKNVR